MTSDSDEVLLPVSCLHSSPYRGASFGAALVLTHLDQYPKPDDSTKIFFKHLSLIIIV